MHIPMADPSRQYALLRDELEPALIRLASSGQYIGGDEVRLWEEELGAYLGVTPAGVISCANGTDALEIAYQTIGLVAGDEVIMPSANYVASAEAALRLGLRPVWADISGGGAQAFNVDPDDIYLTSLLSERTRALVGVNLYGHPVDAERLQAFCRRHGLIFIEDNAQGLGGTTPTGKRMGSLGDISTISFFPTKPLGCLGDGGAIITSRPEWVERARMLARHGQTGKYQYHLVGRNSRLDALQAGVLRIKLRHLASFVDSTRAIARYYLDTLSNRGLELPDRDLLGYSTFHQFTLCLPDGTDRDALLTAMRNAGIALQLYYPEPLHATQLYSQLGTQHTPLLRTEHSARTMLSLPIFPLMSLEESEQVAKIFILHFTL